jgi:UDP-glucose 4-epimerase
MQGKPFSVFGDGRQSRAFSYIDDVAPVIARSVDVAEAGTRCSTSAQTSRRR